MFGATPVSDNEHITLSATAHSYYAIDWESRKKTRKSRLIVKGCRGKMSPRNLAILISLLSNMYGCMVFIWYTYMILTWRDRDISSQTIGSNLFRQAMVDIIKLPAPSNYRGGNSLWQVTVTWEQFCLQTSTGLYTLHGYASKNWIIYNQLRVFACNRDICSKDVTNYNTKEN